MRLSAVKGAADFRTVTISLEVLFAGRVQGVGFRYSVRQIATGFDVTGSVRNLADGRVELFARGDEREVREFLRAISESHLRAHIKDQTERAAENAPLRRGFEILHD